MVMKHVVQAAIAASQVVGRAFVKAVRQEVAASQAAAKNAGGGKKGTEHSLANATHGMRLKEAQDILNVDTIDDPERVYQSYDHLFKVNDKADGGSLYIQSKVVRARERIEQEWKNNTSKDETQSPKEASAS